MHSNPVRELVAHVAHLRDRAIDPSIGLCDSDLLARYVADRDPLAFEALVWRHARLVMGVCRRQLRHVHDAEDAFQATFLVLARKAGQLRSASSLSAWLHTTAYRIAVRARRRPRPEPLAASASPVAPPAAEFSDTCAVLDEEIRRLPERFRTAFVLCELEGRSHADVARELRCPKGTIDSRMAAARRRLRDRLTRRGLTLAPAVAVAATAEWATGEAVRAATLVARFETAPISPAVAHLAASAGGGRWLFPIAATVALGLISTWAAVQGSGTKEEPKKEVVEAKAVRFEVGTKPLWKRPTIGFSESDPPARSSAIDALERFYTERLAEGRAAKLAAMPPMVPVASGKFVYYQSGIGPCAVAVQAITAGTGDDDGYKAGELSFFTQSGTELALNFHPHMRKSFMDGLQGLTEAERFRMVSHRTLANSMAVVDNQVFHFGDLGLILRHKDLGQTSSELTNALRRGEPSRYSWGAFTDTAHSNEVLWNSCETGKLRGKVLAKQIGSQLAKKEGQSKVEFAHVLALPLIKTDQWRLMFEVNQSVRLLAIKPSDLPDPYADKIRAKGFEPKQPEKPPKYDWVTDLVTASKPLPIDGSRRLHALYLSEANGLILCPTNLGRVVAVEARTGKVRWTHEYAPVTAKRFESMAPEWVVVPPVVAGDRYVYAPADHRELLCLNVADGKKVWSLPKGDGLYPAVAGDRVVIVGEKTLRAVHLADGREVWKSDLPGLPCGRGAVLGDTYLVPVSEPKTWRGMIAVVELKTGKVRSVLKPEADEPIGNLVVHNEFLLSQTFTEIAVFPIRKVD